jgi:chromosome segregation ATPase
LTQRKLQSPFDFWTKVEEMGSKAQNSPVPVSRCDVLQQEIDKCDAVIQKLKDKKGLHKSALAQMEADIEYYKKDNARLDEYEAHLDKKLSDLGEAYHKLQDDMAVSKNTG